MARSDEITDNDLEKYLKTKQARNIVWHLAIDKNIGVNTTIVQDEIVPDPNRYFSLSMFNATENILYDHFTIDKVKSSFRERKAIAKLASYQNRVVYENVKSDVVKAFFGMKEGISSADAFINKWFPEIFI
jgi:hypothetical protein